MCRLFAMTAGDAPVRATFWLLDAPDSLRAQSHREADGTGLGYFDHAGEPRVEKQPIAAFEDRRFAREARRVCSRTFVAHVRHATTGALTAANTHPFAQAARIFAHNGVIGDLPKLDRRLGEARRLVLGESDSERFFALITAEIEGHDRSVDAGITAAVRWVVGELPIVSINFVLATRTDIWALRYPATDGLYVLERPAGGTRSAGRPLDEESSHGTRLRSSQASDRPLVIVASERMDDDPAWREVRPGELIHVGPSLELETQILVDGPPARTLEM